MSFASIQKTLTVLMAAAAALPIVLSGEVSTAAAMLFGLLVAAGWFLEPPLTGNPRFRRAVTGIILALFAAQAARALAGAPIVRMALEFTLLLLGLKLGSRYRHFDYQQIAILAFLQIIGATVTTYDVSYAASFVAFVVLCPPVLALAHLRHEMERRFRHDDTPESRVALTRLLASKRVVSGRFVLGTGLLALPVLAMTALLFVSFPRFGLGFFGRLPDGDSVAGFTSEVKIGDIEGTRLEERIFLRLEPLEGALERPARLALKMRGAVFDVYARDTWRRSDDRAWRPLAGGGGIHKLQEGFVSQDAPGYDILLESLEPPYLFVPEGAGIVITQPVARKGILKSRKLEMSPQGVIRYDDPSKVGIRYRVNLTGAPLPGSLAGLPRFLELPPGTDRLAAMARRLAGDGSAAERARGIVRGLRRELRYSSGPAEATAAVDGAATAMDRFLFERRTGTCEHFATAATLMLRSEGIPARMVTGFSSAVWNPIGEYYAVQARSAHAWTEAFVDGRWITLDATPASPGAAESAGPSTIALLMDAIRMKWHKHVVGYDASSQMELGIAIARRWKGAPGAGIGALPWGRIGAGAVLAAAAFLFWRHRRRLRASRGRKGRAAQGSEAEQQATALYRVLERRTASLGFPRAPGRTPAEHLGDLAPMGPSARAVAHQVTTRYHEVRFGGGAFLPGELELLRREAGAIRPDRAED
jgi:transglutaminase-like putative cysteine protease